MMLGNMLITCYTSNCCRGMEAITVTFEKTVGLTKYPFVPSLSPPHSRVALLSMPDLMYLKTFSNCSVSI